MDILTIISIVFLVFFIVVFIIMVSTFARSRKDSKELNTSVARDVKNNPLSVGMMTVLFAIITSVIFGTTNSIDYVENKMEEIYEEGNAYHASIEATRFLPDALGEIEADINVAKIYSDYHAKNLDEIVNFLYTGDESVPPMLSDFEIGEMVRKDFLIQFFDYGVADTTSKNILHVFYLLKKSDIEISFKYQPTHLGEDSEFMNTGDSGLTNHSEIKIIRDENKVSYVHEGMTIFPTSQRDVYETNITSHKQRPGREIINEEASVGEQYYQTWGFQEGELNEKTLLVDALPYTFDIVDINETPQNVVPPAFQNQVQFGEITHDMTTTLVTSRTNFDKMTIQGGTVNIESGDIAILFNEVKADNLAFNSIEYNEQIDKNVQDLEAELSLYINSVPPVAPWSSTDAQIRSTNPIVYAWNMETYYKANASMVFSLSQQDTVINISSVIIPLFSTLILLIILLFLKRRTEVNQERNMTLKSLGYSPKQIAVSYLVFPFVILITGWAFGMLIGQSIIQLFWMNRTQQKVSFQVEMFNDFIGSTLFLFAILAFISVISFIFVTLLLKKNIVEVMNGSTVGKPNVFVRMSASRKTNKSNFTSSYRRSNILRQMSKSLFIFVAIATSTIVFLFGATTANFAEVAKTSTGENFNFDYIHYGDKSLNTVEEADVETYENYDFGAQNIEVYMGYKVFGGMQLNIDETIGQKKYQYGNLTYEKTSGAKQDYGIGRYWYELQQDIVEYMETESLHGKKITIEASDIMQVALAFIGSNFSQLTLSQYYAANKTPDTDENPSGTLYTLMAIESFKDTGHMEKETITKEEFDELYHKEFYINGVQTNGTYNNLSLASLYSKIMDAVKSNLINVLPKLIKELEKDEIVITEAASQIRSIANMDSEELNKIDIEAIIDLINKISNALESVLEDHGILTNEQYMQEGLGKVSIGMGQPHFMSGEPIQTDIAPLHIPEPDSFTEYYSLTSLSGESIVNNHMDYSVEDALPVYIPYSEAKLSELEAGDYFYYVAPDSLLQDSFITNNPEGKVKLQVVGVYSSYFSLGYPVYAGATDKTSIEQTYASKVLRTTQSHNTIVTGLADQYNSTITKSWSNLSSYGTWYSQKFEDTAATAEWTLLDENNPTDVQAFFTFESSLVAPIPFSIVPTVVEVQYKDFDATIELFVYVSFIISILVIMIIIKEIVDSTKSEVSTIKAMGYGKYKTASLVAESQIISMMVSAIVSVPIALWLISIFENVLLVKMGLVTSFTTNPAMLVSFFALMMVILIIAYFLIILLLRNTKALLSTKAQ